MTFRRSLVLLTAAVIAARLLTLPGYVQNNDGFYFVHGVERYSVGEMRPHFPGYPVYIWLGKLFALLTGSALRGLHALSALASTLSLLPIALLASAWSRALGEGEAAAARAGLAAALIWALTPLPWLQGSEVFSDPVGLLLALAALLLCWRSIETGHDRALVAAAAVAGLTLGTRVAYVSLLLPLAIAAWWRRRAPRLLPGVTLAFLAAIGLWAGWQWAMDGPRLVDTGRAHLQGHYGVEGLTVATDPDLGARVSVLARTLIVNGLGGWWPGASWARLPAMLALGGLTLAALARLLRGAAGATTMLPWLWITPYALGVFLSFDVGFARYSLPLVAFLSLLAGLGLPRSRTGGVLATLAVAVALGAVSVPLALEHRRSPPVESQLARWLREHLDPARTLLLVSASDPPTVALFVKEEAPGFPVGPSDVSELSELLQGWEAKGRTAYATTPPAGAPEEWLPVARFCRNRLLDLRSPGELWLFRRDPQAGGVGDLPACEPLRP